MGPGVAVPRVLREADLKLADMDIIEMHEAFGGQVACNLRPQAEHRSRLATSRRAKGRKRWWGGCMGSELTGCNSRAAG